jgi:hypothetical protein
MIDGLRVPTIGAFAYLADQPATCEGLALACARVVVEALDVEAGAYLALYRHLKEGRWRTFSWKVLEQALADEEVLTVDLMVPSSAKDVKSGRVDDPARVHASMALSLRGDRRPDEEPYRLTFAAATERWAPERIAAAGRRFLETVARLGAPLSGGVFRAPTFKQAQHEIGAGWNIDDEPEAFRARLHGDRIDDCVRRLRRLYPITLVGPQLAAAIATADRHAPERPPTLSGALATQEVAGSLLVDAHPAVVESWDPGFVAGTTGLRRRLWPFTTQNPSDAAGFGIARGSVGPEAPSMGAVVYLAGEPAAAPALVRQAVEAIVAGLALDPEELDVWSPLVSGALAAKIEAALADPLAGTLDLVVGRREDQRCHVRIRLRHGSHGAPESGPPCELGFCCDTLRWAPEAIAATGRRLFEIAAAHAEPISGGIFRAPTFDQALAEAWAGLTARKEPADFTARIGFDADRYRDRWRLARRLYPVTLLGPRLAAAAGPLPDGTAATATEHGGARIIEAHPAVIETWDPAFLEATLPLRRWLWPHTIGNPADAAGLGIAARRR